MKLLVVEDGQRIARKIKCEFSKQHLIDLAKTDIEAEQKASEVDYAVILLVLECSDKDGLTVCRRLRESNITTPILVIAGHDRLETRITLLENGADDCLGRPFSVDELRARVFALARRSDQGYSGPIFKVQDVAINIARREVHRNGKRVKLRRKEFDILEYLVMNRGRAVSREMILRNAWEADKDSWNNTVDVHIKHLRDKLDKPFDTPPIIKTEYGIGYMIEDTK